MATRWCTMEEVQADLALATGQRRKTQLIDEGCLVYGERPPPRLEAAEECEKAIQMRRGASTLAAQPAPDLRGITTMLRMVQNYGNGDSEQNLTSSTDDVVIISKLIPKSPKPIQQTQLSGSSSSSRLNPNARQFVPRSSTPHRTESEERSKEGDEPNNNIVNKANENTERGADTMTEEQRTEREELEAMLKGKIRASSGDCPAGRRQRYEAIAGLLRLNSAPPPDPAAAPPAALALLTPDYFRSAARAVPDEREVRASINKVTAWLQAETPALSPAPAPALSPAPAPPHAHLQAAPPQYRRRLAARSPPPAPSAAARGDERYEPSERARELSEQYAARAAAAAPPATVWERLEAELRRRDAC